MLTRRGRRRLLLLTTVTVVAGAGVTTFNVIRAIQKSRLLDEARAQGLDAYERQDFATALEGDNLPFVVQHDKTDIDVMMAFADARAQQPLPGGRHIMEAIEYNEFARRLLGQSDRPDRGERLVTIHERLLELYQYAGLRHEARACAERLLDIDPDHIDALSSLARLALIDGEYDVAHGTADHLIDLQPDTMSWYELRIEAMRGRGDTPDDIIETCSTWAATHDGDARFDVLHAMMLLEFGRRSDVDPVLERVRSRGVRDERTLDRALRLFDALGRQEDAQAVIDSAMASTEDALWIQLTQVRRHWEAGRIDQAAAALPIDVDDASPEQRAAWQRLRAVIAIAQGREADARTMLRDLRENASFTDTRRWADAMLARFDLSPSTFRTTLERVDAAIMLRPKDPTLHFIRGEAYAAVDQHDRAMDAFRTAYRLQPQWLAPGSAYVMQGLTSGRVVDAYDVARDLLRRATTDRPEPYVLYARAHLALDAQGGTPDIIQASSGRPIELHTMLASMVEHVPEHADLLPLYVEALLRAERHGAARDIVQRIRHSVTAPVATRLRLADVCRRFNVDGRVPLIRGALRHTPRHIGATFALADAEADMGNVDGAMDIVASLLSRLDAETRSSADIVLRHAEFLADIESPSVRDVLKSAMSAHPDDLRPVRMTLDTPSAWQDEGLIDMAIDGLRSMLGEDDPAVRLVMARRLVRFHADDEKQLAAALTIIAGVLDVMPSSREALILMTEASLSGVSPSIDRAVTHLERAVSLNPMDANLLVLLIDLLQRQGSFDRASSYLTQLAMIDRERAGATTIELDLLMSHSDFTFAAQRAASLVDATSSIDDRLAFAELNRRAGDIAAAEETYESLLADHPKSSRIIRAMAGFYAATARLEEGAALIRTIDQSVPEREAALGLFYQQHRRDDLAEKHFQRALDEGRNNVDVRTALAISAVRGGDHDTARLHAIAGLTVEPENVPLRTMLGVIGLGTDASDRMASLESLREVLPDDAPWMRLFELLADVPVVDGQNQPRASHCARMLKLVEDMPDFMPAWQLAVELHRDADEHDDALELARRAANRFPTRPEPCAWGAELLASQRRWSAALPEALEWRRRTVDDLLPVDAFIAHLMLHLDRPRDARSHLATHEHRLVEASVREPKRFELWLRALVATNDVERAWRLITPLLDEDPRWSAMWIGMTSNVRHGIAYQILIRITPVIGSDPPLRLMLASAWNGYGRRQSGTEAYDIAERIIGDLPEDPAWSTDADLLLASIDEGRGRNAAAIRRYRAILDREPAHIIAMNNLAALLASDDRQADEAVELARAALEHRPDDPDLLDTLAGALLSAGRLSDAMAAVDRAIERRPGDPSFHLRAVRIMLANGSFDEAAVRLDHAEDLLDAQVAARERHREDFAELRNAVRRASAQATVDL